MSVLEHPVERRSVLKGFLIAGPSLAIAVRLGLPDGAGAFPTKTEEVPVPIAHSALSLRSADRRLNVLSAHIDSIAPVQAPRVRHGACETTM